MSFVTIGDLRFKTPSQGAALPKPDDNFVPDIRWTSATQTVGLTALNGNGGATFNLQTISNSRYITLLNAVISCYFTDAATAIYNVSNYAFWSAAAGTVYNGGEGNSIYSFYNHQSLLPMNLQLVVNSSRQFTITTSIDGGDVQRYSGITPGAGDTVSWTVQFSYIP